MTRLGGTIIAPAETDEDIRRCFPALRVLRPHLTDPDAFVAQVRRQREAGYRLYFVAGEDGPAAAAVGFRLTESLSWGRFVYIDDLITLPEARGRGYGGALLDWVVNVAREAGCDAVHLDSGHQRFDAHRLYLNKRFKIIAHHFALDLRAGDAG
jgi:GNAT superfamily N-acetyltransferase